jgi:hypothetical protein
MPAPVHAVSAFAAMSLLPPDSRLSIVFKSNLFRSSNARTKTPQAPYHCYP